MERPGGTVSLEPSAPAAPSANRIDLAAIGRAALEAEDQHFAQDSDSLAARAPEGTQFTAPAPPAPPAFVAPPPTAAASPSDYSGPPPSPYQPAAGIYQPPAQYPPQPAVPTAPGGYYPYGPADGNTSGMGPGYPVPREAEGWTFAGCIPYGIYCFVNGNSTWGIVGLLTSFFGLHIVNLIYVGIKGKEMAWQGRRFESLQQFNETMRAWNTAGILCLLAAVVFIVLYIAFIFVMAGAAFMEGANLS
jgi:hypothetical protein